MGNGLSVAAAIEQDVMQLIREGRQAAQSQYPVGQGVGASDPQGYSRVPSIFRGGIDSTAAKNLQRRSPVGYLVWLGQSPQEWGPSHKRRRTSLHLPT